MNRNIHCALLIGFLASPSCAIVARADDTLQERRQRVEKMDPQAKQELLLRQKRFVALEREEKEQLRHLHEEIQNDPNRDELRRVLAHYYDWLRTLSLHQQAELRELPPQERIRRIGELRAERARRGSGWLGSRGFQSWGRFPIMPGQQISPADREVYLGWIRGYADDHGREFLEKLPAETKRQVERQLAGIEEPARCQESLFWLIWLRWHLDHPESLDFLTDEELERLQLGLSAETQSQLAPKSPTEKRVRLSRSIHGLVVNQYIMRRSEAVPAVVGQQELDGFFEKNLDPKQQDAISTSSPRDVQRRLFLHLLNSRLPEELHLQMGPGPGRSRRGGAPRGGPGPGGRGSPRGPAHPGAGGENHTGQSPQRSDKRP